MLEPLIWCAAPVAAWASSGRGARRRVMTRYRSSIGITAAISLALISALPALAL